MKLITQTNRLYLREFLPEDGFHFYHLNTDEDVLRYTGDEPFASIEDANHFILNYNQYKMYGMGRWAVCDKTTNEFLGWCGLKYHPNDRAVEVGYRFYKKHWNKGYATECAKACIDYGFNVLKLKEIYAHAHIKNKASHSVIKKCEMQFIKDFDYDGMPAKVYVVQNPHYTVEYISTLDTYTVRHPVLREGRPIEDCHMENDDAETTFHLGLHFKNQLIGVVTFMKNNHALINQNAYQLRGMAILKDYQNKGLGELLVAKGETSITQKNINTIWCNAREKAVNFYKRLGFKTIGEPFEIDKIGTHFVMYKTL